MKVSKDLIDVYKRGAPLLQHRCIVCFIFTGAGLFLSSGNSVLSDYGLIKASQFNTTHGVWCQSSSNTSNLTVTWYLPNGAQVPTSSDPSLPVYAYNNSTGQAGLLRTGLLGNHQGLYNCLVRNGSTGMIISSLFVAAIRDTEYNSAGMLLT